MAERLESKPFDVGKNFDGLDEICGGFFKKIVVDLAEIVVDLALIPIVNSPLLVLLNGTSSSSYKLRIERNMEEIERIQ